MEHVYKSSLYLSTSGFARKLIRTEYNFEIQNKATKCCSNKLKNKAVGAYFWVLRGNSIYSYFGHMMCKLEKYCSRNWPKIIFDPMHDVTMDY